MLLQQFVRKFVQFLVTCYFMPQQPRDLSRIQKLAKSHATHGGESGSKVIALICSTIKEITKKILLQIHSHTHVHTQQTKNAMCVKQIKCCTCLLNKFACSGDAIKARLKPSMDPEIPGPRLIYAAHWNLSLAEHLNGSLNSLFGLQNTKKKKRKTKAKKREQHNTNKWNITLHILYICCTHVRVRLFVCVSVCKCV